MMLYTGGSRTPGGSWDMQKGNFVCTRIFIRGSRRKKGWETLLYRETFVAPSNADDNVRDVPLQANDDDDDDNINVDPLPAIYDN